MHRSGSMSRSVEGNGLESVENSCLLDLAVAPSELLNGIMEHMTCREALLLSSVSREMRFAVDAEGRGAWDLFVDRATWQDVETFLLEAYEGVKLGGTAEDGEMMGAAKAGSRQSVSKHFAGWSWGFKGAKCSEEDHVQLWAAQICRGGAKVRARLCYQYAAWQRYVSSVFFLLQLKISFSFRAFTLPSTQYGEPFLSLQQILLMAESRRKYGKKCMCRHFSPD